MKKISKRKKNSEPHLWRSLLYGGVANLAFTLLCLVAMTKIAYESKDPQKMLLPLSLVSLLLCGFGAGFLSAKFYRRQGATIGAIAGFAYCLVLLMLSFVFEGDTNALPWLRWLSYPVVMIFATAGGMAGKEKIKKRRHARP